MKKFIISSLAFLFFTYFFIILTEFIFYISISKFKTDLVQNLIFKQTDKIKNIPIENKIIRPLDFFITQEVISLVENNYPNFHISLGGQPNQLVFVCDEEYPVYTMLDQYGFRNKNSDYQRNNNILLIGDSFAFGECVNDDQNIKANLERLNYNVLNFSIGGGSLLCIVNI